MIKYHYRNYFFSSLRFLKDLGIFYASMSVLLLFVGTAFIALHPDEIKSIALSFIVIITIHNFRKDRDFIKHHIKTPTIVFAIDYFTLSLPIIYQLTQSTNWLLLSAYIVSVFLFLLTSLNLNISRWTNIPLRHFGSLNPIIKSNLRTYFLLILGGYVIFYSSIFINSDNPIHFYFYQGLIIFTSVLPTKSENHWYTKNFSSPLKVILLKLKDITITYLCILLLGIIPFLVFYHTIIYLALISIAGYLAITTNILLAIIFKYNKLFLAVSQLINVGCIIISIKLQVVLFFQFLILFACVFIGLKILNKRYSW